MVVGNGIKWGAKDTANAVKIADTIKAGSRIIGNASALILSGSQAVETVKNIHATYVETGEVFSWGNTKEFITLGLSVAGMGLAGSSIVKSGKSLKAMWQGESVVQSAVVSNATKKVAGGSGSSSGLRYDLQMFAGKSGSGIGRTRWGARHTSKNIKHNNAIEDELDKAFKDGATSIRKNRVQRDINGKRVYSSGGYYTRPDASYILNGKKYNINYISNYMLDNLNELDRELEVFKRMSEADPNAINRLVFKY